MMMSQNVKPNVSKQTRNNMFYDKNNFFYTNKEFIKPKLLLNIHSFDTNMPTHMM